MKFHLLADGRKQNLSFRVPAHLVLGIGALVEDRDLLALSLTDVRVASITKKDFLRYAYTSRRTSWQLSRKFAAEHSDALDLMVALGRQDAAGRIAHILLKVARRTLSEQRGDLIVIPMPMTQEDIADFTGLTTAHVNRTLGLMRRDGIIEYRERMLVIKDVDRMKQWAQ